MKDSATSELRGGAGCASGGGEPETSFYFVTYGCQMNRHDSHVAAQLMLAAGFSPAESPDSADVLIFNTCSVREHAEERVWSNLGSAAVRAQKTGPENKTICVIGCMAQKEGPRILQRAPGVQLVVGTASLASLPHLVAEVRRTGERKVVAGEPGAPAVASVPSMRPRPFQAFVAVSRGCDNRCSYCIVPSLRGSEQSRPQEEIEQDVRRLLQEGVSEVTLLGQNVDAYGKKLKPGTSLAELLRRVSKVEAPGKEGRRKLDRIRFITNHPRDITEELLDAVAELPAVMPYIHVPAQSGSNRILKAMRRGYTRERYEEIIRSAREKIPGVGLAGDFIVGFPGETQTDFDQTLSLLKECRYQNVFVFKYSARPGTSAADLADDVPNDVKKERNRILLDEQRRISEGLNRSFIGREVEVLVEGPSRRDASRLTGRTRSGRIAVFDGTSSLAGQIVTARVVSTTALTLFCEVLE